MQQAGGTLRVSGIWDPAAEAIARIAAGFPDIPALADAAAVIAASDCVYIASPPASHLGHARAALGAGKAVFVEKPLAVDVADARAFVAEAGDRAGVNFPFASSPAVASLKEWLAKGEIGAARRIGIEVAFARWPRSWQVDAASWLDRPAQGGFTREVVLHFLFLSHRLGGALHGLEARGEFPEEGKSERRIEATLLAGDIPVELRGSVGTTAKDDHNIWTLEGDKGAVRLRDWSIAERRLPEGSWQSAPDAMPNEKARPLALKRQLEGVVRLTKREPHHLATPAEALRRKEVVEVIGELARDLT